MSAIVIGAGPAGLACAAAMQERGIATSVLEQAQDVGPAWRGHYDRLHLHTSKDRSSLPFQPMPREWPRYPSRAQVIEYLEDYANRQALDIRFGARVEKVLQGEGTWRVIANGEERRAGIVVFATGLSRGPVMPDFRGLGSFPGPVIHSSEYRNPAPFAGMRVLVVGFGNSGGEIALDLAEAGLATEIVVRSPVNLVPREIFGVPVAKFSLLQKLFPPRVADALTAPLLRYLMGDYSQYGLEKSKKGPVTQVVEDGRIPLIDLGTLAMIRNGRIRVRPAVEAVEARRVRFVDGTSGEYDAMIMATGYRPDLRPILGHAPDVLDSRGIPLVCGAPTARPGLFFCAYHPTPNGQLHKIGKEALAIAACAARGRAA